MLSVALNFQGIMILRNGYLDRIRNRLLDYPVIALSGPRQVGKTTLAHFIAKELSEGEVHHFDLESPAALARLSNPEQTLLPLQGLVILDEIQRMPELFPILRVLADRVDWPARFLLLGSASLDLIKGVNESLAGRIAWLDVNGLTMEEVGADQLRQRWWRGGFPRAYLARNDQVAQQWLEDFIRTCLERDIPQLGISIPSVTLRRFWTMMAHYHGQIWNASELARSLGSSEATARRYLDLFSGIYLVRQLPPWFENLKKRQVKAPKVYIRDSGICHALLKLENREALESHPKVGASWEGFALEEMLSLIGHINAYFWATHSGAELDLLVFYRGKRFGFEFKYSEQPQVTKSMHVALEDLKLDQLYIVYPGESTYALTESIQVTALPALLDVLKRM